MATGKRQKRVGLTCECGTAYTLNTIHDLPSPCKRCGATLDMSAEDFWKFQESLLTLMRALGLGGDYWKELDFAKRISKKVASPLHNRHCRDFISQWPNTLYIAVALERRPDCLK